MCILFILFVIDGFVLVAQKYKFDCHFFIISLFSSWLRSYIYLFIHLTLWWSWTRTLVLPFLSRYLLVPLLRTCSSQWNGLLLAVDVVRPQKSVALKNAAQLQLCVGISTKKKGITRYLIKSLWVDYNISVTQATEQNCWR